MDALSYAIGIFAGSQMRGSIAQMTASAVELVCRKVCKRLNDSRVLSVGSDGTDHLLIDYAIRSPTIAQSALEFVWEIRRACWMLKHKFQPPENRYVVSVFKNLARFFYQCRWIVTKIIHHSVLTINMLIPQYRWPRIADVMPCGIG